MRAGGLRARGRDWPANGAGRGRGAAGGLSPAGRTIVPCGLGVGRGPGSVRGSGGRLLGSAAPTWALCCVSVADYRLTD